MSRSAGPLVTVIVTTYNGAAFLPRALASVRNQTYEHWECLVVDDGSTDSTPHLVQELAREDARFRLMTKPREGFPSRSRNVGLAAAKGDFVAALDHDDFWHPAKLACQVEALRKHPDAAFVHTPRVRWTSLAKPLFSPVQPTSAKVRIDSAKQVVVRGCHVTHSSFMASRRSLVEANGYHPDLLAVDDYHLFLKLARRGPVVRVDTPLTYVHVHDGNLSRSKTTMVAGLKALAKMLADDSAPESEVRSLTAQALKSEGILLLRSDPAAARNLLLRSLAQEFRAKTLAIFLLYPLIIHRKN